MRLILVSLVLVVPQLLVYVADDDDVTNEREHCSAASFSRIAIFKIFSPSRRSYSFRRPDLLMRGRVDRCGKRESVTELGSNEAARLCVCVCVCLSRF